MLSLTRTLTSPFLNPNPPLPMPTSKPSIKPSSIKPTSNMMQPSGLIPASPGDSPQKTLQLYQPFRPPPSPVPSQYRNLDTAARLEILSNRLGPWFEYAPLISALLQEGFTPPSLEEVTGISGVEQNRFVVASQVRDSLIQTGTDPEIISHFDTGGAELLYEIRLLSASQRSAAAGFIVANGFDVKQSQDLARAMKDFPRRRGDKGWDKFDYTLPGDCLSFMYYRQSREHRNPSEQRTAALEQALKVAATESAKMAVLEELKGDKSGSKDGEGEESAAVRVPVVRLKIGEVAEASSVAVLPVCRASEGETEVVEAPWQCKGEGDFRVVVAEKGWKSWVVLPRWEPVAGLDSNGGVTVAFPDARVLPWKVNRWYQEEAILVVVNRSQKAVEADDGFYLVAVAAGSDRPERLQVERGSRLKEAGTEESLGTVVLVVRPPKEEVDDQLSDEDWE
ncbi:rubisco accumulation factor 1.1, chloroplastic [Punica granatum]|nr:rubisco accumulation factor 1.1, chloroplastic [Punica granatum]OWM67296.1 hypothetical protein CDL15_Pgr000748 [Punica granatum]